MSNIFRQPDREEPIIRLPHSRRRIAGHPLGVPIWGIFVFLLVLFLVLLGIVGLQTLAWLTRPSPSTYNEEMKRMESDVRKDVVPVEVRKKEVERQLAPEAEDKPAHVPTGADRAKVKDAAKKALTAGPHLEDDW